MLKFSKSDLDGVLFKTAIWHKGFEIPTNAVEHVRAFGRLGKRKKLLALIALTDPENVMFPNLLERFWDRAGTYAWYALNWVILDSNRVSTLLQNPHITHDAKAAILTAKAAGRCVDEISKILNALDCQKASLAIAQFGSLKQRNSLVEAMDASDALKLVSGSEPEFVQECIKLARSLEAKL